MLARILQEDALVPLLFFILALDYAIRIATKKLEETGWYNQDAVEDIITHTNKSKFCRQ